MTTGKDVILVTGATGHQGGATARELLAKGHKVRAMTRHTDSPAAQALAKLGAEVVRGDYADAASIERALAGVWGVFSVQNTWEAGVELEEVQGKQLAQLAKKAGVQHFVYTSVGSAHRATDIPHFENKWRIEETVRTIGFPSYTILRPVFFMENLASPFFLPAIQQGQLAVAILPTTALQMIAVSDIGRHAARAFEQHAQLNGKAIDLAGDHLTMPEVAAVLSKAAGREIRFVQVPIEDVRNFSADYAKMLEWFDLVGYDVDIPALAKASGITPVPFAQWAGTVQWSATAPAV